jgi:hypothetical protein
MIRALLLTYCLLFTGTFPAIAQQPSTPLAPSISMPARTKDGPNKPAIPNSGNPSPMTGSLPDDVIIGKPQPIPYSRAFPLLDGLFQDVSAIQLSQLQLNANAANASNLDALIQQFQATVQYSQTMGLQNAAAAQQGAAYSANASLQTQLLNQASQLIGLQLNAQQQLGQAQAALTSLPATATTEQTEAAQQAVKLANDNLNSIAAQIANVKNLLATTAPSAPSYSTPSPSPVPFPSPFLTPSLPGSTSSKSFEPSFPASKQIENQVNLLWERLAHLVNTLAQSDNPDGISLVKFNTGIIGGKSQRKKKLLSTQYSLTCSTGTKVPLVMDLFPRNAAVNITDMKYKDSRFGLGALLSFFSVGANVAYNREHLRITQALGQSAYITGYGIETGSFGWVFSPSLGEDVIAPGDRTTFALINAPEGCGEVKVNLINATWDKDPVMIKSETALKTWPFEGKSATDCNKCIERIAYSPTEFDPGNNVVGAVTVNMKLNVVLDREQTISVNGIILKRARDTYGRATGAGGSGGLLQASALDPGTWIPISSKELIMNLNPTLFTRRFPSIFLNSPNGSIDVNSQISDKTQLDVAGVTYKCPADAKVACAPILPAIGRPKAIVKRFAVARWIGTTNQFIITPPDTAPPTANSASSGGLAPLQVITGSGDQPWSAYAKVMAFQDGMNAPLQCRPMGERLICNTGELDHTKRTEFEIFDSDYAASAVKGSAVLEACAGAQCSEPLVWRLIPPKWDAEKSLWNFRLLIINVEGGEKVQLGPSALQDAIVCSSADQPCYADIKISRENFGLVKNWMQLQVFGKDGKPRGKPSQIGNLLTNISPILTFINEDQTRFSGQNLVFDKIVIGKHEIPIKCAEGLDCYVLEPGFNAKDEGYLYFVTGAQPLLFKLLGEKERQIVAPRKPKPAKPDATPAATNNSKPETPQNPAQQLQQNPDTRLFSVKEQ